MELNLDFQLNTKAIFQIEKFKDNDIITYSGKPFDNIILNDGFLIGDLNLCSIGWNFLNLELGSSNTPVDVTQNGLINRLYSSNSTFNNVDYTGFNYYPHYFFRKRVYQFDIGSCTGTLREIGLKYYNYSSNINRQLIKDSNGDPMDLVVAADEGLRVTVEIRVSFGSFKPYSQIYKLKLNEATSGDITFAKDAATKIISWTNLTTATDLFGSYATPNSYFKQFIDDLNTLDTIIPVVQVIKDPADNNYLIMCNPENPSDMNLTIQSHTLVGGSPELTILQPYESQIVSGTWEHTNETTAQVTAINYQLTPICSKAGIWNNNHGFWGTYVGWLAGCSSGFGNWYIVPEGGYGASSRIVLETVNESVNVKKRQIKTYWAPGVMNANTFTFSKIFFYSGGNGFYDSGKIFKLSFDPGITITNVEEFSFIFNLYWGR